MVATVAEALCDQTSITLIRFDSLSLLGKHGSRCKYDTFDPSVCELVVKGITEAPRLITAFNRIIIVEAEFHLQRFNEADDLFIVWSNLYLTEKSGLLTRLWVPLRTMCNFYYGHPCRF